MANAERRERCVDSPYMVTSLDHIYSSRLTVMRPSRNITQDKFDPNIINFFLYAEVKMKLNAV